MTSQLALASFRSFPSCSCHCNRQPGSDSPSKPPGAEPSTPAGPRMAWGSPLHFMNFPVYCTITGGRPLSFRTLKGGCPKSWSPCQTLPATASEQPEMICARSTNGHEGHSSSYMLSGLNFLYRPPFSGSRPQVRVAASVQ